MATFFVAPTGNTGDGSRNSPFGSLPLARDAVRRHLADNPSECITVELAGGTYYLSNPLEFGPEDSGAPSCPAIWKGADDTEISAGKKLTCAWDQHEGEVLKCSIGAQIDGISFSQLYINGRRQILARYPNGDSRDPGKDHYVLAAGADTWPHSEVYFSPESFTKKKWRKPEEAILHIFPQNHWGNTQYRLSGINREKSKLELADGGWQIRNISESAAGLGAKSEVSFIENVFEELDAPGEWYYDQEDGILYWYPEPGVDPDTAGVEISIHSRAIVVSGTRQTPVSNLRFENIQFAHTERTFLDSYEIPSMGDWAIHRGGAIHIAGADHVTVKDCTFNGIGGNGVFVDGYASHVSVLGSSFADIGESAVCFVGESHLNLSGTSHCTYCGAEHGWDWDTPSENHAAECTVKNNLVHDIGVFGKQTAGVFLSLSRRMSVVHNHIYNTPRAAVCINDGLYGGHLVEFNDIHDTVRETGDHGPFNSWGREPFWCRAQGHGAESHPAAEVEKYVLEPSIIRHNIFRDSSGWGIDLDDGSSYYQVYGNLCIGISVKLREGINRVVENNIFYKPVNPPAFHRGFEGNGDRYLHNIVVMDSDIDVPEVDANFRKGKSAGAVYDVIAPPKEGSWFSELEGNLFFSDIGHFKALVHFTRVRPSVTNEFAIEEWRALGYDNTSKFADPLFIDPDNGDFRLHRDSPAFEMGFREFPLDQFGIENTDKK